MNKRREAISTWLISCVCAAGLLVLGTGLLAGVNSKEQQAKGDKYAHPLARLKDKARKAKGGELASVDELAGEIFNQLDLPEGAPGDLVERLRARFVRAEMAHRRGQHRGISEGEIARMINRLAEVMGAPEYMKTDEPQVRQVRVGMMSQLPQLISQEVEEDQRTGRLSLKTEMAPLEAAYVAVYLAQQKMTNEWYQVSPDEWRANVSRMQSERRRELLAQAEGGGAAAGPPEPEPARLRDAGDNPKVGEVRRAMADGFARMGHTGLETLLDTSLDELGVSR